MSNLEFGRTLVTLKDILMLLERNLAPEHHDIKLIAKAYEILDRNINTANEYINYQVNYMMEKSSKKGTIPPPFDTREDSKTHD